MTGADSPLINRQSERGGEAESAGRCVVVHRNCGYILRDVRGFLRAHTRVFRAEACGASPPGSGTPRRVGRSSRSSCCAPRRRGAVVIDAPPDEDPELRLEQDYLDLAHAALAAMHRRAKALLDDLRDAGHPDLDYQAALMHRIAVLAESQRPLLFGRIDEEAGPTWHIGRRHVEDTEGDPVVVDWRAPIAMPFYQARAENALGLARRRQVMVDRAQVIAVADALLAELERASTGEMLDIVATIQAEQDEIIRAPLDLPLAVQGGPGTGKTAVGLHRAAFLLYN